MEEGTPSLSAAASVNRFLYQPFDTSGGLPVTFIDA